MKRSMFRTLAKISVGLVCVLAFTTANVGCANKNCKPCHSAKNCPPGCTKPCCKKADGKAPCPCPPGCTKPCCKKAAEAKAEPAKTDAAKTDAPKAEPKKP
jgi:hypothetical protein